MNCVIFFDAIISQSLAIYAIQILSTVAQSNIADGNSGLVLHGYLEIFDVVRQ